MGEKAKRDIGITFYFLIAHLLRMIPHVGEVFDISSFQLVSIYQTVKGIEENLAKFMKASDLEYIRNKEYGFHFAGFETLEEANNDAEKFYDDHKGDFDDIEEMIKSSEIKKNIEGRDDVYKDVFIKGLRYYFKHDDGRIKDEAEGKRIFEEKEKRERKKAKREEESASRERQIDALKEWFDVPYVDEGKEELISYESSFADMLRLNEEFFKGFLRALQDIQVDEDRFNEKSLDEAEKYVDVHPDGIYVNYSEGYKYAVRRNKLSPEELKEYYPNEWIEEVEVDLTNVEKNLKSLEDHEIGSPELETPKEEKESRNDITVMKADIAEMKGNIKTITESIQKLSVLFEAPKPKETGEKYERLDIPPRDTTLDPFKNLPPILPAMRGDEALVATPPAESVNLVVEEVRAGFENILNAFAESQTNPDPTAGEDKILTVSLTDENANNISTLIVEKLNEEEAAVPAENAVEGVTNEDLGIEVRDSKRSLKGEIGDIKAILQVLLKLIEKKAMTFDDIYKMVFRRLAHEHEMQTGRRVGR